MITANLITDRKEPGKYDWRDFNRVQDAVTQLNNVLLSCGYSAHVVSINTWFRSRIPTMSQLNDYIDNIKRLRDTLGLTNQIPYTISRLTYIGANQIEQLLIDIEDTVDRIKQAYYYSGELFAGEV